MTTNNIIELTPFRADLTRALARRAERLLTATDPAAEVAGLEPLEAYYIVREIGPEQAVPILRALSAEQWQACIDLDCWHRFDFAADSLDEWLAAVAQAGPEALATTFFSLDYVVQLLYFSQTVTVYDPDTDQVPPEDEDHAPTRATTPDGFFLLELKTEQALKIHPFTVLDALYQYDYTAAHRLLAEVRVDPQTQIEEEALRLRNGRLRDLGFAPPDEATILFSRPAPQPPPLPRFRQPLDSAVTRLPSVYAGPLLETTLLQQALSLIVDPESLARLEQEIVWTINSAIIAYGEKTRDIKQITDIAERVRDTVSLGLEALLARPPAAAQPAGPPAAQAAELLEAWSITDLFRHGFAATQGLRQEARQAIREPGFEAWHNLADTEQSDEPADRLERAFMAALLGRHPLRGGFDLARPDRLQAFACLADLEVARVRLQRLVARFRHPA